MGQRRMTLYLLFWLLHKCFFPSSMTEVRHRGQTATDSAFTACWTQFALSREHSMYWQSKTIKERCYPVQHPSSMGAQEEAFSLVVSLWKLSGNSKRLLTDSRGTWPSLFQFFFCVWKALRQRSIEERTRDYFCYDYCYYFAQLHRGQNLGTFCKEKFVFLFLWPN